MMDEQLGNVLVGKLYAKFQELLSTWTCPATAELRFTLLKRIHLVMVHT